LAILCVLSSANAGFFRVFASVSGLCLGQPWLGQSRNGRTCVACRNVCPALDKDVSAAAELGSDNVDDLLGVAWLHLCALRNVETPPQSECEFKPAGPQIAASRLENARKLNVRFGSKADMCVAKRHVRFTLESGHLQCTSPCPLWANSGLMQCSKQLDRIGSRQCRRDIIVR
jgi:hypothetical protein